MYRDSSQLNSSPTIDIENADPNPPKSLTNEGMEEQSTMSTNRWCNDGGVFEQEYDIVDDVSHGIKGKNEENMNSESSCQSVYVFTFPAEWDHAAQYGVCSRDDTSTLSSRSSVSQLTWATGLDELEECKKAERVRRVRPISRSKDRQPARVRMILKKLRRVNRRRTRQLIRMLQSPLNLLRIAS